jgi:hypothetical protein
MVMNIIKSTVQQHKKYVIYSIVDQSSYPIRYRIRSHVEEQTWRQVRPRIGWEINYQVCHDLKW